MKHTHASLWAARRAVLAASTASRAPSFYECIAAANAGQLWAITGRVECWRIGATDEDVLAETALTEDYYGAKMHRDGPWGWAVERGYIARRVEMVGLDT